MAQFAFPPEPDANDAKPADTENPNDPSMIRAAVAKSTEPNSARAALAVAREVTQALDGRQVDWCVAFVTGEHAQTLPALLESLSGALETPYVVGCSATGVLVPGWETEQGPALGVLAVSSDQIRATPFIFSDEGDRGMTAGVRLGQRLLSSRDSDDLLLVWPDPFHVRPDRLLQSLDAVLGGIPVVGGAASLRDGDNATLQFCGTEARSSSVSGLRLGGKFDHTIGITQGCRPLGPALRVSGCHENLVLEIDGRPALDVLREQAPANVLEDLDWGLNFLSVGLLPDPQDPEVRPGEYLVRNIVTADPDTGVLALADRVEEGQYLIFVHREGRAAEQDMRRVLQDVATARTGCDYRFGLYFNCLARGRSLYGREGMDSALIQEALPGVPALGFSCNAEIAPLRGANQLFTYSGVLLLVSE